MVRKLCLRGGTIVTMDPQRRIIVGDVLVEGQRITAIGDVAVPADTEVVDVAGHVVTPGFVQGHVHLGQALFRGLAEGRDLLTWLRERIWPLEAAHDEQSAYWSGMLGAADCMLAGTTTIHEIGIVRPMDAIYRAIEDSGIRAVAGKCLMDTGHGVPDGLLETAEDALADARALHGRWHGAADGRIEAALCPRFILSCSEGLWRGTVALAHELGLPIHTHLLEHPREELEVREVLGEGQMEFLHRVGVLDTDLRIAHGVQFDEAARRCLDGRTLSICHCPSANCKLGSGIANLGFLRSVPNIRLGIGCDGAPCNNDLDILEEMRLAALLQGVRQGPGAFSAEEAFALATIDGARALAKEADIGSIEVGKLADLVVLDLDRPTTFAATQVSVYDRIVYTAARDAVRQVYVGGECVVRDGRLLRYDEDALRRRPQEVIQEVLGRAGLA